MTYPIANVVYGFAYTKAVQKALAEALYDGEEFDESELDPEEGEADDDPGWSFLYSASPLDFEPIGYFGKCLSESPYWEFGGVNHEPTPEQRVAVDAAFAELPESVKELAGAPKVVLVWSDS